MMWSFGIVPNKIVGKFGRKSVRIIAQLFTSLHKFFLERSVESLNHAIDSGRSGVDEVVWNMCCFESAVKVTQELMTIVCLDCSDGVWVVL